MMRVSFWSRIRMATSSSRALGRIVLGPAVIASSAVVCWLEGRASEYPEHDVVVVRDDADVPTSRETRCNVGNQLVEPAGWNIGYCGARDAGAAICSSVEWESEGAPVGLAGHIVVDA
jgi:hypothetical protein